MIIITKYSNWKYKYEYSNFSVVINIQNESSNLFIKSDVNFVIFKIFDRFMI